MPKLNIDALGELSKYLHSEVGFFPRRTKIINVPSDCWNELCQSNSWDESSSGVFSPKTLSAYIKEGHEFEDSSTIHEFLGHGLFYEYHSIGKILNGFEKRNLKKISNKIAKGFDFFSEAFALWNEDYFSQYLGIAEQFEKKYRLKMDDISKITGQLKNCEKEIGLFGMFAELGFPKFYDSQKAKMLLEKVCEKEKINNSKIGILYGSRKPYSDIDFFIVSNEIKDMDDNVIDIFTKTPKEFEEHLKLFAVSLRDPLLKGEFIFGDKEYFEKAKHQWANQPITEDAIKYNIQRHKELKAISSYDGLEDKRRLILQKYAQTYLQNALNLKQGKRE